MESGFIRAPVVVEQSTDQEVYSLLHTSLCKRPAGVWKPDSSAKDCEGCHKGFNFFRRRHHCRKCGGVFCASCSTSRAAIPHLGYNDPVRVCDKCTLAKKQARPASCRASPTVVIPTRPSLTIPSNRNSIASAGSLENTPGPRSPCATPSPTGHTLCSSDEASPSAFRLVHSSTSREHLTHLRRSSSNYTKVQSMTPSPSPRLEVSSSPTIGEAPEELPVHFTCGHFHIPSCDDNERILTQVFQVVRENETSPLGLKLQNGFVTSIESGTPAAQAGISVGMQLLSINSHTIERDEDALRALKTCGRTIPVVVKIRCKHHAVDPPHNRALPTPPQQVLVQ